MDWGMPDGMANLSPLMTNLRSTPSGTLKTRTAFIKICTDKPKIELFDT